MTRPSFFLYFYWVVWLKREGRVPHIGFLPTCPPFTEGFFPMHVLWVEYEVGRAMKGNVVMFALFRGKSSVRQT